MRITKSFRLTHLFMALTALGVLLGACGTIPGEFPGTTPVVIPPTAIIPVDPTTAPVPVPTDPPLPRPTATPAPACIDAACFVADVTIPDNTVVAPGIFFVKTWRLRNAGTCTWTTDYAVVFARGVQMAGPAGVPLPGIVRPGETVDLSITLTAPNNAGSYIGRWQLRNAQGAVFGIAESSDGTFLVRININAPVPTPIVPPTVPVITEWMGEYFDTMDLDLVRLPVLVRNDTKVDFDWNDGAPAAGLPADAFSVRWSRRLAFAEGDYRFHLLVDDGAILYIDDKIVVDAWKDGALREVYAEYALAGGDHDVRVEYYDQAGHAQVRFWYERIGAYMPDWKGEYYTNPDLGGTPILVQNEGQVNFDWGLGSAAAGLPVDAWSARWSRTLSFSGAAYRFHILVNDGARLYIDDTLVLNAWQDGNTREITANVVLAEGNHKVRLEFYERTGEARIRLWWEVLPPADFPDWKGEYYTNMELSGRPALVQNEGQVDFAWGLGAAAAGLPVDRWSARWSRWVNFAAGTYIFYAQADNGIRVYLDGTLIIDGWYSNGQELLSYTESLEGPHRLVVEYYENGGGALARVWW